MSRDKRDKPENPEITSTNRDTTFEAPARMASSQGPIQFQAPKRKVCKMTYFEKAVSRTTGFGVVTGLSIVPGLILGIVLAIASSDPSGLVLAAAGPVSALLLKTPLHYLFGAAARIPFSIIFVGPVLLAYFVFVKPAEWFALKKQWITIEQ